MHMTGPMHDYINVTIQDSNGDTHKFSNVTSVDIEYPNRKAGQADENPFNQFTANSEWTGEPDFDARLLQYFQMFMARCKRTDNSLDAIEGRLRDLEQENWKAEVDTEQNGRLKSIESFIEFARMELGAIHFEPLHEQVRRLDKQLNPQRYE